ncbi:MAG: ATP-dependent Clp protease ATP-binding subunit, partial [Candidatus Dojkabacteria bacterium]|nr:ATP-dependent Clp protease ATP-binding subunit [Candidatus Dojkabacteria bacterium]
IDYNLVKNTILNIGNYQALNSVLNSKSSEDDKFIEEIFSGSPNFDSLDNETTKPESTFYTDMNELAIQKKFLTITGRENEITRLMQILMRKTKNNPILVGPAGVGKTAIVQGFVNKIVLKEVPPSFFNTRVISLDIAGILSGSRLRGDVEERLMQVINECIADGNTIIFIDEIHMIVGAGSSGGKDSLDIANLLKPYLTDSDISIIGATTFDEYNKYFAIDPALNRRFQPIKVEELNPEASKKVIYALKQDLESYHNVKIPQETIDLAVELTNRFIKDRYLPDKAIDVIDEACASLKLGVELEHQPEISNIAKKLVEIQNQKNFLNQKKDLNGVIALKTKEEKLLKKIEKILNQKSSNTTLKNKKNKKNKTAKNKNRNLKLTPDLIKKVVYDWTKIPLVYSNIVDKRFKNLFDDLKKHIIGQDRVLMTVSKAIQKASLGLNKVNKPISSFLFLGPSGVGKTATAKIIAQEVFGSQNSLIQINMSEYMESHSVSKFIGSPPGYVGFQEGGILTNFVKNNPYCVVLFDEIEKAHQEVLNILLQLLDEGELTDSRGLKVDFRNTIIIMTSNIGSELLSYNQKIGFNLTTNSDSENENDTDEDFDIVKSQIIEKLNKTIKPEILNRIDVIEVFRRLNKNDSLEITKLLINSLKIRLVSSGIYIDVTDDAINEINNLGYDIKYGVRNLSRVIEQKIENTIVEYLLSINNNMKTKQNKTAILKIIINYDKNTKTFTASSN